MLTPDDERDRFGELLSNTHRYEEGVTIAFPTVASRTEARTRCATQAIVLSIRMSRVRRTTASVVGVRHRRAERVPTSDQPLPGGSCCRSACYGPRVERAHAITRRARVARPVSCVSKLRPTGDDPRRTPWPRRGMASLPNGMRKLQRRRQVHIHCTSICTATRT